MSMRHKKIFIIGLLFLEIVLLIMVLSPSHIHRRSAVRAFSEWQSNPSPQTEAIWKRESSRLRRGNAIIDGVIIGLLCLNTIGIVMACKNKLSGKRRNF